ncbi:MAG TPA: ChaN family lipoprotein [Thermodesulfobacteriota bacterium]|nr:ChaN family lipoprotein [Thermodesulfobacteriota bacterium]
MACVMTNRGKILMLQEFFELLEGYGIIFVGEDHDSREAHRAELTILTEVSTRDPSLVLALEMFERDVQDTLDGYLQGTIAEDRFLKLARPWPNYQEDYRPLVEWAKTKGIPVIAANIPRRAAAAVAMANKVSPEVVGQDFIYLPNTLYLDSKEYYKHFVADVERMPHSAPMKGMKVRGLFKAQVLKDAVMAASLEPFLSRRILFCCGHFHSDYHLGIPYQLHKNHPELEVAVVTFASYVEGLPMKERSQIGDFIWLEE